MSRLLLQNKNFVFSDLGPQVGANFRIPDSFYWQPINKTSMVEMMYHSVGRRCS